MNLDTFTKIIFMKRRIKSVFVVLFFISILSFGQTKNDSISKRMKLVQPKYLEACLGYYQVQKAFRHKF